jgi:glycosyltransferase involved in cell wall biosynthesis
MTPRVSICVPNLNMRPFLPERFETIFNQTLQDWELFVYDSGSDDGAWEFLQELAAREPRMRLVQGPREGPYPAWNECVRQTKAEFVYIATSDDTMAPDCLEKLVTALERNSNCDLAHCPLAPIDANGALLTKRLWPIGSVFGRCMPETLLRSHVRRAPYDGLLHLTGDHVYLSITQLLIRRSLFSRIGDFPSTWGSSSDFNWEMKASLVANTIHVPDTWASWRAHPKQLTAAIDFYLVRRIRILDEMIQDAVLTCEPYLAPAIVAGLKSHWLDWSRCMRAYYATLRYYRNAPRRRLYQLVEFFTGTSATRSEMIGRLFGRSKWLDIVPMEIQKWIESIGTGPIITFLSSDMPGNSEFCESVHKKWMSDTMRPAPSYDGDGRMLEPE